MLQILTHLLLVEVADNGVDKLSAVAIHLLQHLQRAVVVKLLDILQVGQHIQRIATVLHAGHRVAVYQLVIQILCLQHQLHLIHKRCHRFLVLVHAGHRQIEQLEQCLQILWGRLSGDILTILSHSDSHRCHLTGEGLVKF